MGQGEHCSWNDEDARAFNELMLSGTRQLGVVIYDTTGRITGWNRGAHFITGFDDSEVIGQPLAMLILPEDRALRLPDKGSEFLVRIPLRAASSAARKNAGLPAKA